MKTGLRYVLLIFVLGLAACFSPSVWANATTCSISSTGIAFTGSTTGYDPTSNTAYAGVGNIAVTCTPGCAFDIIIFCLEYNGVDANLSLSTGSGTYLNRQMAGTSGGSMGQALTYNLYVDLNHTQVFGNGGAGSNTVTYCFTGANVPSCSGATYTGNAAAENGNSQSQSVPVYGLLPSGQDVSAGTYSDTITATITF